MRWFRRSHPAGAGFEDLAARHLEAQGMTILERNVASKLGEIDIVASDPSDDAIVFVEVKGRRSHASGFPEEALTPAKRRRLASLAEAWLARNRIHRRVVRFDVVAVDESGGPAEIRHYRNAFFV